MIHLHLLEKIHLKILLNIISNIGMIIWMPMMKEIKVNEHFIFKRIYEHEHFIFKRIYIYRYYIFTYLHLYIYKFCLKWIENSEKEKTEVAEEGNGEKAEEEEEGENEEKEEEAEEQERGAVAGPINYQKRKMREQQKKGGAKKEKDEVIDNLADELLLHCNSGKNYQFGQQRAASSTNRNPFELFAELCADFTAKLSQDCY
jgi:hypothetical protein